MRIRLAVPDRMLAPEVLEPALENVTRLDEALLEAGIVPPFTSALRAGKVKWKPEPKGHGEHFDAADVVLARGWGDCDDLAPWYASELRAKGIDPKARAIVRRSGPERWHCLVRRGNGSIEDPSIAAGMRGKQDVAPARDQHLRAGDVALHVAKWPGVGMLGRADLPLSDYQSASHYALAQDPMSALCEAAISGACNGMLLSDHEDGAKLGALASIFGGVPIDEAEENWGGVEVGSIFSKIAHAVTAPVQAAIAPVASFASNPVAAMQQALSNPMAAAQQAAQQAMQSVPGASNILPMMQSLPGIQSVLQTGLPLAQQLLPYFSAAMGPGGAMTYPMLASLMQQGMR